MYIVYKFVDIINLLLLLGDIVEYGVGSESRGFCLLLFVNDL